jgi:hypothetical protein
VPALSIEAIEVGADSVEATVRVTDAAYARTSANPELAREALSLLPGLARHSCENQDGHHFARELDDTESAHLLEHLACELMASSGSPRSLRGRTGWDFARDGAGIYRVSLEYDDDVVAIGALKEAHVLAEWLLTGVGERPDAREAIARLVAARERGVEAL